ncbi:MAG: protein kinase [Candidatus Neomarinimicrobiota bacterium]
MIGKTISHFKILEKLGEGGMGKVYKAEDTNLDRIVALKFLPRHLLTGKEEKTRFIHEAKAASTLNHPNIMTIHEICEEEDEIFIVSEFIDGELLSDKIKDNPLKVKDLINTAIGIADGLHAAHEKKIVHRDIKSQNIMYSKTNQAKILDFGLAKQKGMSRVTQDGSTLGTQGYMSPEQVEGLEVDKRSDIFSFGVVLYEMATGRLPFEGDHEAAILYSIMNEEPIPVTTRNPNVPQELARIIHKALEKNVKDRYQHADDMLADMRKLKKEGSSDKPPKTQQKNRLPVYIFSVIALMIVGILLYSIINKPEPEVVPQISAKSIAVLPFASIDRTEESEIFGDGIHDDILTQIAKIKDLKVIARTSVLRYRNTEKSIKEIAQELGVGSILEGSVRRSGNQIRVIAQLNDAVTENHLWAETYDRDYADIFAIQSDVANKIAGALRATLTLEEKQAIDEIPTDNLEAYEFYQQGKIIFNKGFTLEYFESAMAMFEKAVELDPDFVIAYTALCEAHLAKFFYHGSITKEHLQNAKVVLDKAKKLDPNHPSVHIAEGYYYYYGFRDYDNALEKFHSALQKYPNDSDLLAAMGWVKRRQGKWEEALEYLTKATDIDPQSSDQANDAGQTARYLRNWEVAEQFLIRATLANPQNGWAYLFRVWLAIGGKGDLEEGRKVLEEALKYNDSKNRPIIEARAYVEYMNRNYQKAQIALNEYRNTNISDDSEMLWYKGRIALALNQRDLATSYFDSLKTLWVKGGQSIPGDWSYHFWLASAYGGLGMKEEFLKEYELYETLMPFHKDFFWGTINMVYKIEILLWLGEYDRAIDLADEMLSVPSNLTVNSLKLSPIYDPIRDHPRFQELIVKYSD